MRTHTVRRVAQDSASCLHPANMRIVLAPFELDEFVGHLQQRLLLVGLGQR